MCSGAISDLDGSACGSIKPEMRTLEVVVAAGAFRSAVPAERNVL
jgi:hypothetical protein